MRCLRWACLLWGLAWVAGCSGGKYQVQVSFDSSSTSTGVQTIELMLLPGTCSMYSGSTVDSSRAVSRVVLDMSTNPLPSLSGAPAGPYALYARGLQPDCTMTAAGCTDVTVKGGGNGTLSVVLMPVASTAACSASECDGEGHCTLPDAGVPTDSGIPVSSCDQVPNDTECLAGDGGLGLCMYGSCMTGCPPPTDAGTGDAGASGAGTVFCIDPQGHHGECEMGVCVACTKNSDCDDQNVCDGTETCDTTTGICEPGTIMSCDDGNTCTNDSCDSSTGCVHTPVDCNDNNPCTYDGCDMATGCQHTTATNNTSCTVGGKQGKCQDGACDVQCTSDADCDDGDVCNGTETCNTSTGACQPGTPLSCDDGNLCNGTETCDPMMGCQSGAPLNCDDGDRNTCDGCDPSSGCTHKQRTCLLGILCNC